MNAAEARIEFESMLIATSPLAPDFRMNGLLYRNLAVECRWKGWNMARVIPVDLKPLADFYDVTTLDELARAQQKQIDGLLRKLPAPTIKPVNHIRA